MRLLCLLLLASACSTDGDGDMSADTGATQDASFADAANDGAAFDARELDSGLSDVSFSDAAPVDASFSDASPGDASRDAPRVDGALLDAMVREDSGSDAGPMGPPGDLDPSFGGGGVVRYDGGARQEYRGVSVDASGRLLAIGWTDVGDHRALLLSRYLSDGSADVSFGDAGHVVLQHFDAPEAGGRVTDAEGYAVEVGSDGISVAGVARYNAYNRLWVLRFQGDGSLDSSFADGGQYVYAPPGSTSSRGYALLVQSDGRIVVAGARWSSVTSDSALWRFDADGSLDDTFGTEGSVVAPAGVGVTDLLNSLVRTSVGDYVASGDRAARGGGDPDMLVVRVSADGSDVDWRGAIYQRTSAGLYLDGDAVVVAGRGSASVGTPSALDGGFAFARYTIPALFGDPSYGGSGGYGAVDIPGDRGQRETSAGSARLASGDFVSVGQAQVPSGAFDAFDIAMARVNADGLPVTSFGTDGGLAIDLGSTDEIANDVVEAGGRIVLVGRSGDEAFVFRVFP